jgi:hypothetical protein
MKVLAKCRCGWSAMVPSAYAGKQGKCPECKESVRIGQSASAAPASPSPAPPPTINPKHCYCKACGEVGPARKKTPGSIAIEIILWLFLIIPGLIYSFWRMTARRKVCRACGSTEVIPVTSPIARQALRL